MLYFDWSAEKNERLKAEREIGFEDIVVAIDEGNVLAIVPNPSPRYPKQKIVIVAVNNYAYLVPYVESGDRIFFKTIIPSRKATERYIIAPKKKRR